MATALVSVLAAVGIQDITGAWAGFAEFRGHRTAFAIEFEHEREDIVMIRLSIPVIEVHRHPIGRARVRFEEPGVRIGPFSFHLDADGTLTGQLPDALVPVHSIPVVLARVEAIEPPARSEIKAPSRAPLWTFESGSPVWAGVVCSSARLYFGNDAGEVYALATRTGKAIWRTELGGAVRARPTATRDTVYLQVEDGFLYALAARDGGERWRTQVVAEPVPREPLGSPQSRSDPFTASPVVAGEALIVATHSGAVHALDARDGRIRWTFMAGDAVMATPAVAGSRVYVGSFDHHVYALDLEGGTLAWKFDTGAPVATSPTVAGDRVIVGNRSYDLMALDAVDGQVIWQEYVWFSWIHSAATIPGGVGFVGTSDAAIVIAFDLADGRRRWAANIGGRVSGDQVAVGRRVYAASNGVSGYIRTFEPAIVALDRQSGEPVWRHILPASTEAGAYGVTGALATDGSRIYAAALDGRVLAFRR